MTQSTTIPVARSRLIQAMRLQEERRVMKAALLAIDSRCRRCGAETAGPGTETSAVLCGDELLCRSCGDGKRPPKPEKRLKSEPPNPIGQTRRPSTWRLIEAIVKRSDREPDNESLDRGADRCPYCGRWQPMRLACPNHMAKVLRRIGVEVR